MTTPSRSAEEVLAHYQRAMIDMSADDLADLYAVDAVHDLPFLFPGMPDRIEGREQVRAAYRAAWRASDARPQDVRTNDLHLSDDGHVIVAEQTVAGTRQATGTPFAFNGLLILRVRDGLIVHARDYMDGLGVARAMERLPSVVQALT